MKLALVSPLPPLASPAAQFVADLLPHLQASAELRLLPLAPEQIGAAFAPEYRVAPCADLPHLLETGEVDVPIYFVADDLLHAHQVRFVREHPGILVLLTPGVHGILASLTEQSGDLEAYRALLAEEHGAVATSWPERFLWRADADRIRARLPMTGVLCRRSHGVLAEPGSAARLRDRHPGVPVCDLPTPEDPASIASAILSMARQALEVPRELPELDAPDWPSVEVLIVGYNSRRIIGPGLQSIERQDYPNYTCTLVDNASSDGTAQFVRDEFPFVNVIAEERNLGFAGGNNRGFEKSEAKYIVLFNQDAIARRDFIRELVRVAERDTNIAAVGAKMLMMRCPTIINSTGIVVNEAGFAVDRAIGHKDDNPSPVPVNVFGACGGAKLIRRSVLPELGGFDESFFMYFEDVDLCWRMRLAGYQILYAPLAVVHHDWHGDLDSAGEEKRVEESQEAVNEKTHRRRFLCERNRLQCLIKNYSFRSLRRVIGSVRRYDKVRLGWTKHSIRAGREVDYFRMVGKAIRGAWRWNLLHLPELWMRRRRVQKLRRISDEAIAEFIERGVDEPSYVGDLEVIQDRFSAKPGTRIQMGVNDQQALGPGWYGVEPVPNEEWNLRWSKGRAWLYIVATEPTNRLCLRVARGPVPTELHVSLGSIDLGSQPVADQEMHVVEFALPQTQEPRELLEVALECATFRPSDEDGNKDRRVLGIRVAEVWLE